MVGLNISSPNIIIGNMQIIRPISAGILITTLYSGIFDMGESIILQSRKNGIRILKREKQDTLLLRHNLQFIIDNFQFIQLNTVRNKKLFSFALKKLYTEEFYETFSGY